MVKLVIAIPSSLISAILFSIALGATVWLFIIPVVLAVTFAVTALLVNAKFPSLTWDNPTIPVKQGSSTLFSMLITVGVGVLSIVATVAVGQKFAQLVMALLVIAYEVIGVVCYKKLTSIRLNSIDEK